LKTTEQQNGFDKFLEKAQSFCAVQERCIFDVRRKMFTWKVPVELHDKILVSLQNENFLSEKRFAVIFARSKVNQNKWGKVKIEAELLKRTIPFNLIHKALDEIDPGVYLNNLKTVTETKEKQLKEHPPLIRKQKLMAFLTSKGYEGHLVMELLNE
jgi:regulatory protein